MAGTPYNLTGLQPFWNYDSFSIASRQIGGGTGYINTAGAKLTITPSAFPLNPAVKPTVVINEDMNFMFSSSDMMLKFHNNSPFIRRFYNSTERNHTGTGVTTDSLPRHIGLMGRHWIFNYEHCIISSGAENYATALEIGPTGERNNWGSADGSGDFTRPKGIQKKLHYEYNGGTSYFELTTPDYTVYRFNKMEYVPTGINFYYRLVSIVDKNGVGQYIAWELKDTGYESASDTPINRYRIKEVDVSTDGGIKKIPFIKFRYASWGYNYSGGYYTDAFHLVRTMQDFAGNEIRFQYDFDTDIATANYIGKLEKVTYQDGYSQSFTYTNDWAIGSPTVDDYVLTKITDRRGTDWEIAYASAYWRIDNSNTSSTDYHTTSYDWSVADTYTLPAGFVKSGSGYTAGGAYRTVKCVKTDAESVNWPFYHNCLHGPGNVGNLMRRDVLLTSTPTWLSSHYFWDDPAADATNDNHLYLTARPLYGTYADVVQRTEYTTANGLKLTYRTYPVVGSNPNYGVNGTTQDAQYVQYTYTTNENTVEKIEYHKNYNGNYFFSQTTHTYDSNHNLIKTISADNPDPSPGSDRDEESLDLTTYMQYDGNGNLTRSTDARANSSSYYYNQFGAMERSVNQLGSVSIQVWDETFTRLVSSTNATGATTYYSYDPLGQMIATRDFSGSISKTQYDPNGNVIGRADARGHSGRMLYDNKNRLYKTVSPSGIVRELTLSKTGQLQMEKTTYWDEDYSTNEQVIYRRTFYDLTGRVSSRTLPSDTDHGTSESTWLTNNKLAVQYTYNDNSNVLTTTDRYGQVTTNTYDSLDRRETTLTPRIPDTTSGEFIRTTHKTIYSGPMGRVSEEQIQEETSSSSGTSWSVTRAYYFLKKYTVDRAGRTIIVQLPDHSLPDDAEASHTYYVYQDSYYDANGNVTLKQLRQQEHTTGSSTHSWPAYMEYDIANRMVKESKVVSDNTDIYDRVESTFEYDPAGRKTSSNRGGLMVQTTYNAAGRVAAVGQGGSGCGCGGGCKGGDSAAPAPTVSSAAAVASADLHWQFYEYDATGNRVKYSDSLGVFASVTHDSENRPVASTDRAGRVTRTEYWPTGQVKRRISPDGNFIGYEYDIEGRLTKVWESVPEQNSAQAVGPFGGSKDVALTKIIEYYYGVKNDGSNGQNLSWTGTQLNAGTYIAGVRTYTYKGAGPVYYDMVYTSNAHGQPEKTFFIDSDDSATCTTIRLYTWRDKIRQIVHPDTNTIDYEWDDHLRMTAEKLDGDDEKYEYEYCLCGAIKRHKYTYEDSLNNSQTEVWTDTTDDLGRRTKEYYPYPIALDGTDEYHSILYEYDTASRRKMYSDPTFGHTCADTSGWTDDTEPFDEENWLSNEPQRYLYGLKGGLEATGRVASSEIMAGQGEPYFVQRDGAGRIAKVSYPDDNASGSDVPQLEWQYTYGNDGSLKQVAAVNTMNATNTTYGPQAYVVQFLHDDVGRLIRKVVRDNAKQDDIDTRYESKLEYDGRGQIIREQIIKFDSTNEKMQVMSDIQTTYDLGKNPITVKVYDNSGWAYTETRTYAKGYQLTEFSTSAAADVTINTSGSYTYDTNNNLTGTKKLDATRSSNQLTYRAQWTFTYDRKNRLKTYTNTNASYHRGNLWYDGRGRIWQRWQDRTNTTYWETTLTRFVYDGSSLAQEIDFLVGALEGEWVYTYDELTRDYLRHPSGIRQREPGDQSDWDEYFLQANQNALEFSVKRGIAATIAVRNERKSSLDQLPSSTFSNISNLATPNGYIEMYGGSTSGPTAGFDGLVQMGGRHYLAGLGRYLSRMGNNAYLGGDIKGQSGKLGNELPTLPPGFDPSPNPPTWSDDNSFSGGPNLPGMVDCCFTYPTTPEYNKCMRAKYETGWFNYCCTPPCYLDPLDPQVPTYMCLPYCSCWPTTEAPCGGGCRGDHCMWSFGQGGYCGAHKIIIDSSCSTSEIVEAFEAVCTASAACACETHTNQEWKNKLNAGAMGFYTYKDVWTCIADICKEGNLTIICNDPVYCTPGTFGQTESPIIGNVSPRRIHLCTNYIKSKVKNIAAVLLHEMLHQCGVATIGRLEVIGYSATYWISEECISFNATYNPISKGNLVNPPEWWDQG